jgi:hypothetical protein
MGGWTGEGKEEGERGRRRYRGKGARTEEGKRKRRKDRRR